MKPNAIQRQIYRDTPINLAYVAAALLPYAVYRILTMPLLLDGGADDFYLLAAAVAMLCAAVVAAPPVAAGVCSLAGDAVTLLRMLPLRRWARRLGENPLDEDLVRALQHHAFYGDVAMRYVAVDAIAAAEPGNRLALATLKDVLRRDPCESVRERAAQALGQTPAAARAVQDLEPIKRALVRDSSPGVRAAAATALGFLRTDNADCITRLLEQAALQEDDCDVRAALKRALGLPAGETALRNWADGGRSAVITTEAVWILRDLVHHFGIHHPTMKGTPLGWELAQLGSAIPELIFGTSRTNGQAPVLEDVAQIIRKYSPSDREQPLRLETVLALSNELMLPAPPDGRPWHLWRGFLSSETTGTKAAAVEH